MIPTLPSTFLEFQRTFATEAACERHLARWRWPDGFKCPRCSHAGFARLRRRGLYQCNRCKKQASVTAGTALHKSKLPLRMWFWAIYLVSRHKKSISALQLQRDLGLGTYRAAWLLLHKIRACFDEKSGLFPLRGKVEVDEAYVGRVAQGEHGGRGSSATCVVAAVETRKDGTLGSARVAVVASANARALASFVAQEIDSRSSVVSTDGWAPYKGLAAMGYRHQRHLSQRPVGRGRPVLPAVHLLFSNLKTWLRGRFHNVSPKYLPAYIAEFLYRFNRRHDVTTLFGWVVRRLMTKPARTLLQLQAG